MRKILLTLFALIMVTGLMSCSPHSNITHYGDTPSNVTLDFHNAPFEGYTSKYTGMIDHDVFKGFPDFFKYGDEYLHYSFSPDHSFLYIIRFLNEGEATLETYSKCQEEYDVDGHRHNNDFGVRSQETDWEAEYYSIEPIAAYYFRFESYKYGFATDDYRIGMAIEIKGCWNIGPNRKYHEERSDYLDGFVYFTCDKNDASRYFAQSRAFCYRYEEHGDPHDYFAVDTPLYISNQWATGYDSFNADGETKEGWNNRISVLSGYASGAWEKTYASNMEYPKNIANPYFDMVKVQVSDGSWIEVIETPDLKPAYY